MARKANIARAEIHQACWQLLEKNTFPNIPRLAEYFAKKDGRRCSNTTLMNAIADWEETYKEHQRHQLKELDEVLLPVFKYFSREVTQKLGQLLDEKASDIEQAQALRLDATQGSYLSLSASLIALQKSYDSLLTEHHSVKKQANEKQQQLSFSQQRYQEVLSQNHVLSSQIKQQEAEKTELNINLSQKEVDLAKLDNKIALLKEDNARLKAQLSSQQKKNADNIAQWKKINDQLNAISQTLKTSNKKNT